MRNNERSTLRAFESFEPEKLVPLETLGDSEGLLNQELVGVEHLSFPCLHTPLNDSQEMLVVLVSFEVFRNDRTFGQQRQVLESFVGDSLLCFRCDETNWMP